MEIEYIDPVDYEDCIHFLEGHIPTKEFSKDVVYSIKVEKLTKEEILERYAKHF